MTDEKCDSPDTGMQGSQALSEEISATVEGETAEEPPPDERDRGLEACILDEVVSNVVADDSAFAAVVEEETTGVTLPMPDGIQNEAAPLVAEDESSSVADKAVATPATEHEPGGEDVTEQSSPFQEAAGVTENSQPIPKQEEAVAPDVIHTPGEGIESHASVEASPGVEATVATVSEVSSVVQVRRLQEQGAGCQHRSAADGHKNRSQRLPSERSLTIHIHPLRTQSRTTGYASCYSPRVL